MCPFHELGKCCKRNLYFRSQVQGTTQKESLGDTAVFCHHFIVCCWSMSIFERFYCSIFASLSVESSAIFPSSVKLLPFIQTSFLVSVILFCCVEWLSCWIGSALLYLFLLFGLFPSAISFCAKLILLFDRWCFPALHVDLIICRDCVPIVGLFDVVRCSKFCCSCFFIERSRILFCCVSNFFFPRLAAVQRSLLCRDWLEFAV